MLVSIVAFGFPFMAATGTEGLVPLGIMTAIAGIFGIVIVMAIGGADMAVVISPAQQLLGSGFGGGGLYAQ